ncbi:MAG: rhodanese-like domain-containing protein [Eubacteriales bacterium]|nr:rhodanese-like domain-containing protein [Eubacteriales bacterium]
MKLIKAIKWTIGLTLLLAVGMGYASEKAAEPVAEDTSWQFHDIVDMEFVAQHVKIPMDENVMLIDSRPRQTKYDSGHIPMAVSIPDTQFEKMTDRLPTDKNVLLIYYCEGMDCRLSHKSAKKPEALGYTNVKVFAEGYPKWISAKGHYPSVSVEWVKKQIDARTDMVLVDSRPRRTKYDAGHIPTAVSIPDSEFDKHIDLLPQDKDKLLVFYCEGFECKLSHKSAARAIEMGYTNVKVFSEGYPAWAAHLKSQGQAPVAVKAGKNEGSIDIAEFEKMVTENPESIYLVDVRDPDEFATGSFKTAVNIPVDELEKKLDKLPTDKPVVFVCGTGARSGEAYYMVQDLRPAMKNVYYLDAGLTLKKDGSFVLKKLPE